MRLLNTDGMEVVHIGEPWTHEHPPCSREMTSNLENHENLVYRLQPVDGDPCTQVPALNVQGAFYRLSLRMMKCIWRHIQLKRGFRNLERGHFGAYKLRIPLPLLREKTKTQVRCNVSDPLSVLSACCICASVRLYLSCVCLADIADVSGGSIAIGQQHCSKQDCSTRVTVLPLSGICPSAHPHQLHLAV